MSLADIYTELIAEHSRSTENKHELAGATVKERGHNPSCGDEITLELIVEAGKIKDAATAEFTRRGPAGTTIERIAKRAGVNKERVYNYFGSKDRLFSAVLRDELTKAAEAVPPAFDEGEDVGDYAGRLYDYHRQRPELIRLLCWEALTFDGEVPEEELRREHYQRKIAGVRSGQETGALARDVDPGALMLMIMSLTGWWSTAPQVARMLCGPLDEEEHDRRRAVVVEAARRLAAPRE